MFTLDDEYAALKQRAASIFAREALAARKLKKWEAFMAFDADDNGLLSAAEVYGALRFLNMPALTAEDVVDFLNAGDLNRDGLLDYKEYLDLLEDPDGDGDEDSDEGEVRNGHGIKTIGATDEDLKSDQVDDRLPTKKQTMEKVPPYGAEEVREVIFRRKREEMERVREERARREAYQAELDRKIFEEELKASASRKGGANPRKINPFGLAARFKVGDAVAFVTDSKTTTKGKTESATASKDTRDTKEPASSKMSVVKSVSINPPWTYSLIVINEDDQKKLYEEENAGILQEHLLPLRLKIPKEPEMSDGKESVGSADNAKQETSHVNAIHTKLEELSINIAAKRKEKLEGNINDQTKTTEYSFAANSSPLRTVVAGKGASFKAVMASTLRKKAEKTRMCCTKGHEVIKLSYKNNYERCALCKKSGVLYHCEKMYSSRWNSPCRR